jgi:hypothetical protein
MATRKPAARLDQTGRGAFGREPAYGRKRSDRLDDDVVVADSAAAINLGDARLDVAQCARLIVSVARNSAGELPFFQ